MPTHTPQQPDIFYLVLHGLISIIETPTDLRLYMLDVGPVHSYEGGNWGAFTPIDQGSNGTLLGVKDGGVGPDPIANPVVKIPSPPATNTTGVYSVITVPKPRKVHSIDKGDIQITTGSDQLLDTPKTLSAVRILEYEAATKLEDISLKFGPGPNIQFWRAEFSIARLSESQRISALHLIDDPPLGSVVPVTHHVDEFALSCQVLGTAITIKEAAKALTTPLSALPLGFSRIELGLEFPHQPNDLGGGCTACCGGADGKVGGHG